MCTLKQRRTGLALFFTLATIVVVSIIVYGMVFFMRGEVHLTENYVDSTIALLLAESGVEEATYIIKTQGNNPKSPLYEMVTKKSEETVDLDLSSLEGKNSNIPPLVDGGKVKARVTWKHDPEATKELVNQGLPADVARQGYIQIDSRGTFHNTSRQVQVKKVLKATLVQSPFPGNSIGMIAPEHGLYFNKSHRDSFKINPTDFWDPWGLSVKGGKVFMRDGAKIDLPKWLILAKFRNELEHPWLDMGIGWNGYNGGTDLTGASEIEYSNNPINRNYYKWMGLFNWPWWVRTDNELYNSNTKKVENYDAKKINLYPTEVYRRLANRLVDPVANPQHAKYFQDVNFQEAFGRNQVTYRNVIPLFGWGDWRKVANKYNRYLGNPTRAHDTSHAVEINGVTFIKGDVYIEGWVKGKGLLVVEGDVYVGGDILTLPDDNGGKSAVGIIALRDPRDTAVESPKSGRIIYKPHHDSDWSRLGITHPFRNLSPRLEGCFHAQGGLELDTDSSLKKMINMEIVGNLSMDYFDRRRMPNDIMIKHFNWQDVLSQSDYDFTVDKEVKWTTKYDVAVMKQIAGWREVEPTL